MDDYTLYILNRRLLELTDRKISLTDLLGYAINMEYKPGSKAKLVAMRNKWRGVKQRRGYKEQTRKVPVKKTAYQGW